MSPSARLDDLDTDDPAGTVASPVRTCLLVSSDEPVVSVSSLEGEQSALQALGVRTLTVLSGGTYLLVHVECSGESAPEGLAEAVLAAVVPGPAPQATAFTEVFAWERAPFADDVPVAILLRLRAGAAAAYRAWLASGVVATLEQIWHRHDIARHDVLQADDLVVGYYSCAGPAAVTAAFADPAGVAVMEQGLGALLDLEATSSLPTLEETFTWSA